jgi:hypothetical protein
MQGYAVDQYLIVVPFTNFVISSFESFPRHLFLSVIDDGLSKSKQF